jgi:hypothetical protein
MIPYTKKDTNLESEEKSGKKTAKIKGSIPQPFLTQGTLNLTEHFLIHGTL